MIPKANTFHVPFGEMTITLDDVSTLLAILVVGNTVSLSLANEAQTLVSQALGVTEEEAREEHGFAHGCSVWLEWLQCRFQGVTDDCGNEVIKCSVRTYTCFICSGAHCLWIKQSWVSVYYLHCLKKLDSIHNYAWGAAVLTY